MPKRKISISEALNALEEQGLKVKVESITTSEDQPLPKKPVKKQKEEIPKKVGNDTVKLSLRAQHCIAGNTYGPGITYVPTSIAAQLMRQDRFAVRYDEELRSAVQKSYVVVRRQMGNRIAHVGVEVDSEIFGRNDSYIFNGSAK